MKAKAHAATATVTEPVVPPQPAAPVTSLAAAAPNLAPEAA